MKSGNASLYRAIIDCTPSTDDRIPPSLCERYGRRTSGRGTVKRYLNMEPFSTTVRSNIREYISAFEQSVARDPEAVAVAMPDGHQVTYAELHQRTTDLAVGLDGQIGEARSGSLPDNGLEAVEILLAAYKRGRANIPLNTQSSLGEQAFMLENGEAECLIFDEANRDRAVQLIVRCDIETVIYAGSVSPDTSVRPYENFLNESGADADEYEPSGGEGGIYYTSGTTGKPRGVIADQKKSWYASTQLVQDSGISPSDTALVATPLYHIVTSVSWTFAHLLANATLVLQQTFSPQGALDLIKEHDMTNVFMIPTQWEVVLEELEDDPRDLDTVQQVRAGGAPMDTEMVEQIRNEVCEDLYIIYGLTESISNVTVGRPANHDRSPGTVGKATFNWEVRVVESAEPGSDPDPTAEVEPPGSGELLARSSVAAGCLKRPEAEKNLFVSDWIRTGDIAQIGEDRNLFIVDRIDKCFHYRESGRERLVLSRETIRFRGARHTPFPG